MVWAVGNSDDILKIRQVIKKIINSSNPKDRL